MNQRLTRAALFIAAMTVAACTMPQQTTSWQKTGADDDARRTATAACRATANREVDREYASRGDVGRTT
ncbi:MAG: hypothetical protein ACTSV1_00690, partial [Alphaproteobacteria bacterium]